jgi:hypothetical protein
MRRQGAVFRPRLDELLLKRYEKPPEGPSPVAEHVGRNGNGNQAVNKPTADRTLEELLKREYRPGSVRGEYWDMLRQKLEELIGKREYRRGSVEDEEKAKDGDHRRNKEMVTLTSGIFLVIAITTVGVIAVLSPKTDPAVRAIASGWVGMIIGRISKLWPSGGD